MSNLKIGLNKLLNILFYRKKIEIAISNVRTKQKFQTDVSLLKDKIDFFLVVTCVREETSTWNGQKRNVPPS